MSTQNYKKEFIEFMVRSNVLIFGDFITKSGRPTPYFVNTGNYKTGAQMAKLGEFYAKAIHDAFSDEKQDKIDALFGPAYKGIPLCVGAGISLYNNFNRDVAYCYNRKEEKDHGEGGSLVGYKLKDGDNVLIIEDVITAGTAIREVLPIIKNCGDVNIKGVFISVDRMERGLGDLSAVMEVEKNYGIKVFPIVTVLEIIDLLYNVEIDGKIIIDDNMREKMLNHIKMYGAKS